MSAYQEIGRDFATIVRLYGEMVTASLDSKDGQGREVSFDARKMRHFDHSYAMTSHSSQGVTAERMIVNMDTRAHPELLNTRFAYVSVSRASQEARIYSNDAEALGQKLSHDASKTSAIDFRQQQQPTPPSQPTRQEKTMNQNQERGLRPEDRTKEATRERVYTPAEYQRHYARSIASCTLRMHSISAGVRRTAVCRPSSIPAHTGTSTSMAQRPVLRPAEEPDLPARRS